MIPSDEANREDETSIGLLPTAAVESIGGSSKDSVGMMRGTAEAATDSTGEEGVDDGDSGASLLDVTPLFSETGQVID